MLKFEWFKDAIDVAEALVDNGYRITIYKQLSEDAVEEYYVVEFEVEHAY